VHGIVVTTTVEADLLEATDDQRLAFAQSQNRVIITQDTDFLRITATGAESPGIAFFRARHSIGDVIRGALLIWELYDPEEMKDRVEYM